MNLKYIPNSIKIKSCIAYNLFYIFGFKYKNVKNDILIDKYKKLNIIQDYKNFLKGVKQLKLYFIKFKKKRIRKNKKYPLNYIIESVNQRLVIIIIYNKSVFSIIANI